MRNISDKFVEKIKTHILRSVTFFRKSSNLWDKVGRYGRDGQATNGNLIRRMRTACWIPKVTNIYLEYVIRIACPLQQWLLKRSSMLRYTYVACLFIKLLIWNFYRIFLNSNEMWTSRFFHQQMHPFIKHIKC